MKILTVVVMTFALAVTTDTALAQNAPPRSANAVTVYTGRGPGPARDEAAVARLLQRAAQQGRIRVIVGLNMTMRDDERLSPGEQARQAQALRRIQDAVAARVLGSPAAAGVTRFSVIPFMSMVVDADQLRRLLDDPAVASIQEDRPVPPS
jgi:hypothetical protein